MKKKLSLTLVAIFALALILMGCGDDVGNTSLKIYNQSTKTVYDVLWNNVFFVETISEFNGTWIGDYPENSSHGAGIVELEITGMPSSNNSSWSILFTDINGTLVTSNGRLGYRTGNVQTLADSYISYTHGSASLVNNRIVLDLNYARFPNASRRNTYELSKAGEPFKPGMNVTKNVGADSGYIFFKVGLTAYRTQELIVVDKNATKDFTFNDFTLVVNVNDPSAGASTLGSL